MFGFEVILLADNAKTNDMASYLYTEPVTEK